MIAAVRTEPGALARVLAPALVAVAVAVALLGLAIAVFFNPVWVGFEQERTQADLWTGYPMATVHAVTNDVLREVYLGPGTFLESVAGVPVFSAREQAHMADVRAVVLRFDALALLASLIVAGSAFVARGARWWWRAVARGAAILALGAVVVGAAFFVFFDQAFTLFHDLFFAAGTWTFDPATDRLVQLFPYAFWTETSLAIALVGLVLTTGTWALARQRANRP